MLEVKTLSKSFGGFVAVNRANLSVEKGEIVAVIGPNGAG
ncbi:MAG: high-affinity branched-chain amino acid ABC transporter ATP-binding protein LivG, partial [Syntrophales bacterium]